MLLIVIRMDIGFYSLMEICVVIHINFVWILLGPLMSLNLA